MFTQQSKRNVLIAKLIVGFGSLVVLFSVCDAAEYPTRAIDMIINTQPGEARTIL